MGKVYIPTNKKGKERKDAKEKKKRGGKKTRNKEGIGGRKVVERTEEAGGICR